MTPERWRQVTAIFHAASRREPDMRSAFLQEACAGDASLRAEVESLLEGQQEAARAGTGFIARAALPQLPTGTLFGPYQIDTLIGAGGMGQVYRATDPRLRRTVAIKVLTPGLITSTEGDARFAREARLLASLSHPNVAAIYGVEDAQGVSGLVLEFIEGPTLAERLMRGRLPVSEALTIARQIALALESAHEKAIVHRDLKPSNVKITSAGVVKVLDFGIARLADDSQAPEQTTMGATGTGMILGTPAYMSPEQARGQPIDKRTDVWAFGCVLYEMLTGRGAFTADTASDSVARVLEREPDWTKLPPDVPPSIVALLKRALRKDANDRLRDIGDARIEISDALAGSRVQSAAALPPPRRWLIPVVFTLAAIAGAAFGVWRYVTRSASGASSTPAAVEFGVMFPNNMLPSFGVAVSPNGRYIAAGVFGVAPQIWLHSLDTSETKPLPGTEGGASPVWSPDSSTIAYIGRGKLWTLNIHGGAPVALATVEAPVLGGGSWSQGGMILFAAQRKLFVLPATGGTPAEVRISGLSAPPVRPIFLPDGRHFILTAWNRVRGEVFIGSLDSQRATKLLDADSTAGFAPPDRLLFLRGAALMTQRLDVSRLALSGEAEVVSASVTPGAIFGQQQTTPSASANGVLAFSAPRGGSVGELRWFDRNGQGATAIPSAADAEYLNPAISPDATTVAANRVDLQTGRWDIWIVDTARGVSSRLTTDPADDFDPVWSPGGKEIAFASERGGRLGLYRQAIAGDRAAERLIEFDESNGLVPTDWSSSPRGDYILYQRSILRSWSLWALPLFGDRQPIRLVDDQFSPYAPHLSPDGHWLAYNSFESGPAEVFVRRFLADGPKKQISSGGGVHPRWTRDGKELVYWSPPGGIYAHDLSMTPSDIRVGPRRTLLDRPVLSLIDGRSHYDITRDGTRLLARQTAGPQGPGVRVILNWTSKLKN